MISGNALEQDYSTATVFYLYLIPRGLRIILPVLKALGKKLRVITYMSPFPESEIPVESFQVTSAKHPDAQWPLFLYDIEPSAAPLGAGAEEIQKQVDSGEETVEVVLNKDKDNNSKESGKVDTASHALLASPLASPSPSVPSPTASNDAKETVFNFP
jgi:hypothetical protein